MSSHRLQTLSLAIAVMLSVGCAAEDDSMSPAEGAGGDAADGANHDPFEDAEPGDGVMAADGCDGVTGEGFAIGQTQATWVLRTGDGGEVSVHDLCGRVVFLEIGAEW